MAVYAEAKRSGCRQTTEDAVAVNRLATPRPGLLVNHVIVNYELQQSLADAFRALANKGRVADKTALLRQQPRNQEMYNYQLSLTVKTFKTQEVPTNLVMQGGLGTNSHNVIHPPIHLPIHPPIHPLAKCQHNANNSTVVNIKWSTKQKRETIC